MRLQTRLKRLLYVSKPAVILEVKLILGYGHLSITEYPRDNSSISSRFVVSLLDGQVSKDKVLALATQLFDQNVLGGLANALNRAIIGTGMPHPRELILFSVPRETINYYPFLLDLKGPALGHHKAFTGMAFRFLEWRLLGDESNNANREDEFLRVCLFEWTYPKG